MVKRKDGYDKIDYEQATYYKDAFHKNLIKGRLSGYTPAQLREKILNVDLKKIKRHITLNDSILAGNKAIINKMKPATKTVMTFKDYFYRIECINRNALYAPQKPGSGKSTLMVTHYDILNTKYDKELDFFAHFCDNIFALRKMYQHYTVNDTMMLCMDEDDDTGWGNVPTFSASLNNKINRDRINQMSLFIAKGQVTSSFEIPKGFTYVLVLQNKFYPSWLEVNVFEKAMCQRQLMTKDRMLCKVFIPYPPEKVWKQYMKFKRGITDQDYSPDYQNYKYIADLKKDIYERLLSDENYLMLVGNGARQGYIEDHYGGELLTKATASTIVQTLNSRIQRMFQTAVEQVQLDNDYPLNEKPMHQRDFIKNFYKDRDATLNMYINICYEKIRRRVNNELKEETKDDNAEDE